MTQKELKDMGYKILNEYGVNDSRIKFKDVNCGRASYVTHNITVPTWSLKHGQAFAIYYVLHEVAHQIIFKQFKGSVAGHGIEFKSVEKELLARYNLRPEYSKAYIKALYEIDSNKLMYDRKKRKVYV